MWHMGHDGTIVVGTLGHLMAPPKTAQLLAVLVESVVPGMSVAPTLLKTLTARIRGH